MERLRGKQWSLARQAEGTGAASGEGRTGELRSASAEVCLDAGVNATFVHGTTGHTVCCKPCADKVFLRRGKCPVPAARGRPRRTVRR